MCDQHGLHGRDLARGLVSDPPQENKGVADQGADAEDPAERLDGAVLEERLPAGEERVGHVPRSTVEILRRDAA